MHRGTVFGWMAMALVRATLGVSAITSAAQALAQAVPQHVRPGTELFVDDAMVESSSHLTRSLHAARKLPHAVLKADKPWENGRIYIYGTVDHDAASGKYRMWFSGGGLASAESTDGIHWTKPELDLVDHKGAKTNLLVKGRNLCFIIHDTAEKDPAKRYKALDNTAHHNFIGMYSADGLNWQMYDKQPLIPYGSEISNGIRDPKTGLFYVYIRPYLPKPKPTGDNQKRLVSVITSPDFENWSEPKLIIAPDAKDDAWVEKPIQRTEFYGMSGFAYGNQYLGLLPVFRVTEIYEKADIAPMQSGYEGPIDAQLVTSRDGLSWQRTEERKAVIPTGPYEYDAGCIMHVSSTPTMMGDEVWYYYTALSTTHGGRIPAKYASIAVAKWRLDGFASVDAGSTPGTLTTKVVGRPGRLEINANAAGGTLVAELLDASGKVIPGYSAAEFTTISTDGVRHQASWGGEEKLPAGEYKIRFNLTNGSLYSYTVLPSK